MKIQVDCISLFLFVAWSLSRALDWSRRTGKFVVGVEKARFVTNLKNILCFWGKINQRRYNIRTGSAAYFWLIGFLVIFLCIVAPPVGTRCQRVRFVFFYRMSYVGSRSHQHLATVIRYQGTSGASGCITPCSLFWLIKPHIILSKLIILQTW